jgi:hypothetical protein
MEPGHSVGISGRIIAEFEDNAEQFLSAEPEFVGVRPPQGEAVMIELTEEQVQALTAQTQGPLQLLNPRTQEVFVLIRQDFSQLTGRILDGPNRRGWGNAADDDLLWKDA